MASKACSTCREELELASFYKTKAGTSSQCRVCCRKVQKTYRENNRDKIRASKIEHYCKVRAKTASMKHLYGLSLEQFNVLKDSQKGCCAICKITEEVVGVLCVDHDHKTGAVRGLLCHQCNLGLGCLKDSVDNLKNTIMYLERGK